MMCHTGPAAKRGAQAPDEPIEMNGVYIITQPWRRARYHFGSLYQEDICMTCTVLMSGDFIMWYLHRLFLTHFYPSVLDRWSDQGVSHLVL